MSMPSFNRLNIWLRVLRAYTLTFTGVKSTIKDAEQTVDSIISGKSLIRFGDGEFGIYSARDIHYQPWSEELAEEFDKIKAEYERQGNICRYILAVPKKYMQCSGLKLGKKRVLISSWADSRLFFKRNFNRNIHYYDSFIFEKKNRDIYSRIWEQAGDNRLIIFVHNNKQCALDFAKTYNRQTIHIKCDPFDAFSHWKETLDDIKKRISELNLSVSDVQVVLSAGPAGKVICYHLSGLGYHCIDTGHCWDNPLDS